MRSAVFLINLLQDVNILRPLIFMASRDFRLDCLLLISQKFTGRDLFGIWQGEIEEIAAETGARFHFFADDWDAHRQLSGRGVIFSASESHLHNHVTTHSVFRNCPPGYVRVTLQHGFECVGFRHSAEHAKAHGPTASFGADYVCTWTDAEKLVSLAPSQRPKLLSTGPTAVLQIPLSKAVGEKDRRGIVCENLHSVRLSGAGDFKTEFVDAFREFSRRLAQKGMKVALRPHPGGQYVLKNKVQVPANVSLENAPMYRTDLRRFDYGISAPSSVLIDMLLAGIPTAVWRDRRGDMDAGAYAGLTTLSAPQEWAEFAASATANPEPYRKLQQEFLERQGLILDPQEVYRRFASIFQMVLGAETRPPSAVAERDRVLFVANARVPTLQLSFEQPLAPLVRRGEISTSLLTEGQLLRHGDLGEPAATEAYLDRFSPALIVFCRYSGPGGASIADWARRRRVPIIYHIDDDLLGIPRDIGQDKHAFHNAPERLDAVRNLLGSADLVYASTENLRLKLLTHDPQLPVVAGRVYCSGTPLRRPRRGRAKKIGYMASADHLHNLQPILPALETLLERNPDLQLELFGSIPLPPLLQRFAERVTTVPAIADYDVFLSRFAEREWDIGICPLSKIDFNLMKANTKWVEYTSVGAAVVASRGTVYDDSCADGCGILADGPEEWLRALDLLVNDGEERVRTVERAQAKLEREYSIGCLREQVLEVFEQARHAARGAGKREHGDGDAQGATRMAGTS